MREKPILFNADMVRAILSGRKTQTRRVVKPVGRQTRFWEPRHDRFIIEKVNCGWQIWLDRPGNPYTAAIPPYETGDVLWVRETWKSATGDPAGGGYALFDTYVYKADGKAKDDYPVDELMVEDRWHPSIHMPREAARLFLRVTDVDVERLQSITPKDAYSEGTGSLFFEEIAYGGKEYHCGVDDEYGIAREQFAFLWESTIKKGDLPLYGWGANPWVWRIQFERIEKGGAR